MDDYIKVVRERVSDFSIRQTILFGALNCEKMLRGYKIFTELEVWGDYNFFLSLTEYVYSNILENNGKAYYELSKKELERNFPDLDNFQTAAASYAFDMCVAFDELLMLILDDSREHALNISRTVIDTVDMFIQQKENVTVTRYEDLPALEVMIDNDEFMKKEIERQMSLLRTINDASEINEELIKSIRSFNQNLDELIDYSYLY